MDILRYFYGDDIRLSRRLAGPMEALSLRVSGSVGAAAWPP